VPLFLFPFFPSAADTCRPKLGVEKKTGKGHTVFVMPRGGASQTQSTQGGTETFNFDRGERQLGDAGWGTAQLRSKQAQREAKQNRRAKKELKKSRLDEIGQRKGKDYGVPDLVQEKRDIERTRAFRKEVKVKRRQQGQRKMRQGIIGKKRSPKAPDLASIANAATHRKTAFDDKVQKMEELMAKNEGNPFQRDQGDSSRRAYMRELRKVVDSADVILEVLDVRDPEGCRCRAIEESILADPSKKLVLVLNKIDLVPYEVLTKWLAFFKQGVPCIPFKASTQQGNNISSHAGTNVIKSNPEQYGSRAVGTDGLMQLLKNYCRSKDIKTAITVGIIGYPNVGKSSLINSMKRSRAVGVSATAGFTKCMQEIVLDRKIKLIDSPGVVFEDSDTAGNTLRNCLNVESMADPVPAVQVLLTRCKPEQLMKLYDIEEAWGDNVVSFLGQLARKKGKLVRTGIADINGAAKLVLQDWNSGKIPSWTVPPEKVVEIVAQGIVSELAAEFDPETAMEVAVEEEEEDTPHNTLSSALFGNDDIKRTTVCMLPETEGGDMDMDEGGPSDGSRPKGPVERKSQIQRTGDLSMLNAEVKKEKKRLQRDIRRMHRQEAGGAMQDVTADSSMRMATNRSAQALAAPVTAPAGGMGNARGMGGEYMDDESDSEIDEDL
jgi:nuclear GTP-binding protein